MEKTPNRWGIAIICTLLMVCLGTVYAWSFFQKPFCDTYHLTNSQVAWVFSLAICFLGLAAAAGGMMLPRMGPTRLALAGGAKWNRPVVTEIVPAGPWWRAEEYHQDHLVKNPGGYTCHCGTGVESRYDYVITDLTTGTPRHGCQCREE